MTSFFEKRDRWGQGMALWVLLGMVALIPPAFWAIRKIELHNDVENWLPSDDPQAQILSWYRQQFPVKNRVIISWDSSSLNDPRVWRFARKLGGRIEEQPPGPGEKAAKEPADESETEAEKGEKKKSRGIRRGGSPYIREVVTPQEIIARIKWASRDDHSKTDEEKTLEAISRLEGVFVGTGKLKIQLTAAGLRRQKTVERMLVDRIREELGLEVRISGPQKMPNVVFTEEDAEHMPDEFPMPPEHHFQLSWRGMRPDSPEAKRIKELARGLRGKKTAAAPRGEPLVGDAFFFLGSPIAVYVTLSEAGNEEPEKAFADIRKAAREVGIPEDELHMGGRSVAGVELNREVKRAAWNPDVPFYQLHRRSPLLLSLIVGIALSFVLLRSVRLAVLVLVSANYTVFLAVALVPLTHGSMNMVLVVMPTLLYVLTISAAIHVANYWRHAAHEDLRTAVVRAVEMARQPCLLASITTAIGLLSLLTSPLRPVRDFGLYSSIGCLISLVVVLVCLPALLQFWPTKRPTIREIDREGWKALGRFLHRHWIPVSTISLMVFAASLVGLKWFRTETKVIRYFPEHKRVVQDYYFLEDNLAGIVPVDIVIRFDKSRIREREENEEGEAVEDRSPHQPPRLHILQRMEIVRAIEQKLRQHPEISGVISLADFRPVYVPPQGEMTTLQRMKHNKVLYEVNRSKASGSARQFVVDATRPAELKSSKERDFHVSEGDELWRITAQVVLMTDTSYADLTRDINAAVQSVLRKQPGTDHVITGMVPVFLRTQQAVLESLIKSFGLAFVVIALVMMVVLRHPVSGLITMIPNLMPVGIVFGLISWAGVSVDIGTMITASVALGIAVDGTLHLLTWFREGLLAGQTRREAIEGALMHCGPAMWQTSAAVGIGLLMLAPAELLLIQRFGWLMASLIGAALVGDVVVLPALLAGPLGHIMERSLRKSGQKPDGEVPPEGSPEGEESPAAEIPPAVSAEPHIVKLQPRPGEETGQILRLD